MLRLLSGHEDLTSESQHPHKSQVCQHALVLLVLGRKRHTDPRDLLA